MEDIVNHFVEDNFLRKKQRIYQDILLHVGSECEHIDQTIHLQELQSSFKVSQIQQPTISILKF